MALFQTVSRLVATNKVHLDRKSKENSTGKIKPKYKLVGHPIEALDQFIFFILSSHSGAYHKRLTVKVDSKDWTNRNPKYATHLQDVSYIDITKFETLSSRVVALKMADSKNGFKCIAELPSNKLLELQNKLKRAKYMHIPIPRETRRIIADALQVSGQIMRKLGL